MIPFHSIACDWKLAERIELVVERKGKDRRMVAPIKDCWSDWLSLFSRPCPFFVGLLWMSAYAIPVCGHAIHLHLIPFLLLSWNHAVTKASFATSINIPQSGNQNKSLLPRKQPQPFSSQFSSLKSSSNQFIIIHLVENRNHSTHIVYSKLRSHREDHWIAKQPRKMALRVRDNALNQGENWEMVVLNLFHRGCYEGLIQAFSWTEFFPSSRIWKCWRDGESCSHGDARAVDGQRHHAPPPRRRLQCQRRRTPTRQREA